MKPVNCNNVLLLCNNIWSVAAHSSWCTYSLWTHTWALCKFLSAEWSSISWNSFSSTSWFFLRSHAVSTNSCSYCDNDSVFFESTRFLQLVAMLLIFTDYSHNGVLINPKRDQEGNKLGSMSGTRAISTASRRELSPSCFNARQDAEGNSRHSDRNISLFPSWSG